MKSPKIGEWFSTFLFIVKKVLAVSMRRLKNHNHTKQVSIFRQTLWTHHNTAYAYYTCHLLTIHHCWCLERNVCALTTLTEELIRQIPCKNYLQYSLTISCSKIYASLDQSKYFTCFSIYANRHYYKNLYSVIANCFMCDEKKNAF